VSPRPSRQQPRTPGSRSRWLKGSGNGDKRARSVAEAIVAYRACDEASESHMFRRPDDEKRRIPGLSDQNGSGVAAGETGSAHSGRRFISSNTAVMLARYAHQRRRRTTAVPLHCRGLGCAPRTANSAHALRAAPRPYGGHDQRPNIELHRPISSRRAQRRFLGYSCSGEQ
jgi:hypothetical protein